MIIKELITKLGFEVDDKALDDLDTGIKSITGGLLGLSATVAAAGVSLFGLVKTTADSVGRFKDLKESLGISISQLQDLTVFAASAGISQDELSQSLTILTRSIGGAKDGSAELQKAFQKVGISTAEIQSGTVNAGDAIERIAKSFDTLPEGPERAALAMQLFGRSGARMIPMLNDLRDGLSPTQKAIADLNRVTEEQVEAADAFAKSFDFLNLGIKGVIKTIGIELMPIAQEFVDTATQWLVVNKDIIKTNLKGFIKGLSESLKVSLAITNAFVNSLMGLSRAFGGVENATKLLMVALSVLSGGAVLFGIGKIIGALGALRTAFITTQLSAIALPVAIGAAVVGLLLIFEDLYVFLNGGDSIIGDFFKKFPEMAKAFGRIFSPIVDPIMELFDKISKGTLTWADGFKLVGQIILNVINTPLRAVYSILSAITGMISRFAGDGVIGKFFGAISKGTGAFADVLGLGRTDEIKPKNSTFMPYAPGATGDQFGPLAPFAAPPSRLPASVTPEMAMRSAPPSASSVSNQNQTSVNQTLQFSFPPGTDPRQAAPTITQAVDTGLDGALRNAARAVK